MDNSNVSSNAETTDDSLNEFTSKCRDLYYLKYPKQKKKKKIQLSDASSTCHNGTQHESLVQTCNDTPSSLNQSNLPNRATHISPEGRTHTNSDSPQASHPGADTNSLPTRAKTDPSQAVQPRDDNHNLTSVVTTSHQKKSCTLSQPVFAQPTGTNTPKPMQQQLNHIRSRPSSSAQPNVCSTQTSTKHAGSASQMRANHSNQQPKKASYDVADKSRIQGKCTLPITVSFSNAKDVHSTNQQPKKASYDVADKSRIQGKRTLPPTVSSSNAKEVHSTNQQPKKASYDVADKSRIQGNRTLPLTVSSSNAKDVHSTNPQPKKASSNVAEKSRIQGVRTLPLTVSSSNTEDVHSKCSCNNFVGTHTTSCQRPKYSNRQPLKAQSTVAVTSKIQGKPTLPSTVSSNVATDAHSIHPCLTSVDTHFTPHLGAKHSNQQILTDSHNLAPKSKIQKKSILSETVPSSIKKYAPITIEHSSQSSPRSPPHQKSPRKAPSTSLENDENSELPVDISRNSARSSQPKRTFSLKSPSKSCESVETCKTGTSTSRRLQLKANPTSKSVKKLVNQDEHNAKSEAGVKANPLSKSVKKLANQNEHNAKSEAGVKANPLSKSVKKLANQDEHNAKSEAGGRLQCRPLSISKPAIYFSDDDRRTTSSSNAQQSQSTTQTKLRSASILCQTNQSLRSTCTPSSHTRVSLSLMKTPLVSALEQDHPNDDRLPSQNAESTAQIQPASPPYQEVIDSASESVQSARRTESSSPPNIVDEICTDPGEITVHNSRSSLNGNISNSSTPPDDPKFGRLQLKMNLVSHSTGSTYTSEIHKQPPYECEPIHSVLSDDFDSPFTEQQYDPSRTLESTSPKAPNESMEFTRLSNDDFDESVARNLQWEENKKKYEPSALVDERKFFSDEEIDAFRQEIQLATGETYGTSSSNSKVSKVQDLFRLDANPKLTKYCIDWTCSLGPPRETRGKGKRDALTMKTGCESTIHFLLSSCGKYMTIKSMTPHHGHEFLTPNCHKYLPQNRKLNEEERKFLTETIKMGGNTLHAQAEIKATTGKIVLFKDVQNLKYAVNQELKSNDFSRLIPIMDEKGATYRVKLSAKNEIDAMVLVTENMKRNAIANSHHIEIDFTYKLNKLGYPVGTFLVTDANGQTEYMALALVAAETQDNIDWVFDTLVEICPFLAHPDFAPLSVMSDKCPKIRRAVRRKFPNAQLYICSYHVMCHFGRHIHPNVYDSLRLEPKIVQPLLELLTKMHYAQCESDYDSSYQQFCAIAPQDVALYFNNNWHNIQTQWVRRHFVKGNFGSHSNNRTECNNGKLKKDCGEDLFLLELFTNFFTHLEQHEDERNHRAVRSATTLPSQAKDPEVLQYFRHLTHYAFQLVYAQFLKMNQVVLHQVDQGHVVLKKDTLDIKYQVTTHDCTCTSNRSKLLPCKHVLHLRRASGLPIFDETLCHTRWTRKSYLQRHRVFCKPRDEAELADQQSVCDPSLFLSVQNLRHEICNNAPPEDTCCADQFPATNGVPCQNYQPVTGTELRPPAIAPISQVLDLTSPLVTRQLPVGTALVTGPSLGTQFDQTPTFKSKNLHPPGRPRVDKTAIGMARKKSKIVGAKATTTSIDKASLQSHQPTAGGSSQLFTRSKRKVSQLRLPDYDYCTINGDVENFKAKGKKSRSRHRNLAPSATKTLTDGIQSKPEAALIPFVQLPFDSQLKFIAEWITVDGVLRSVVPPHKCKLDDVKFKEVFSSNIYNEDFQCTILQSYFDAEAFSRFCQIYSNNKKEAVDICNMCNSSSWSDPISLLCDLCLSWNHLKCSGLDEVPPENVNYFCPKCSPKPQT